MNDLKKQNKNAIPEYFFLKKNVQNIIITFSSNESVATPFPAAAVTFERVLNVPEILFFNKDNVPKRKFFKSNQKTKKQKNQVDNRMSS